MVGRHFLNVRPTDPAIHQPFRRPVLGKWQRAAIGLVNGLEFYDFAVYGFFAVPIGRVFFPVADPWTSLLLSVASFGVGYLARPLGALVIGTYADRHGRKPAMLATVLLIAFATFGIAILPGFDTLGLAAPILLVILRLMQGFALGGETGPGRGVPGRGGGARAAGSSRRLAGRDERRGPALGGGGRLRSVEDARASAARGVGMAMRHAARPQHRADGAGDPGPACPTWRAFANRATAQSNASSVCG